MRFNISNYIFLANLLLIGLFVNLAHAQNLPDTPGGTPPPPIIGGYVDTDTIDRAVVSLYIHRNDPNIPLALCSGTLITPDYVVTAAHCMDNATSATVYFYTGSASTASDNRSASDWIIHPDWANHDTYSLPGDLSIVHLSSSAPSSITPIPPLPPSLAITNADDGTLYLRFAGFGRTDPNDNTSSGTKHSVDQILLRRHCDGSSPCHINDPKKSTIEGRTLFFYEENSSGNYAGICHGDSGGSTFVVRNGNLYVAGVNSYVSPGCVDFGVSTKLDQYSTFITNYVGTITPEDCSNNVDDDGDGDIDCNDSDCTNAPACVVTNEICSNGVDDDGDGDIDCNDSDCSANSACNGGTGDACVDAITIQCGDVINGNTLNGSSVYSMSACSTWGSTDGPEEAYIVSAPSGTQVQLRVQLSSSSQDLDLFLMRDSGGTCNDSQCEDTSLNWGGFDESITYISDGGTYYLMVDTDDNPGNYTLTVACNAAPEICNNGTDDDGDGTIDCNDADCLSDSACQAPSENCTNNVDDDGDGSVDCNDADCYSDPACQITPENCTNNIDDDNDGLTDCADADCVGNSACTTTNQEICYNGIDDDADGNIDCSDSDCDSYGGCAAQPELCDNNIDDDGDGASDCADPDCASFAGCNLKPELCGNGIDDDGDGKTDCADEDCASMWACNQGPTENCTNGLDDDGDGAIDCYDTDCDDDSVCQNQKQGSIYGCSSTHNETDTTPLSPFFLIFGALLLIRRFIP